MFRLHLNPDNRQLRQFGLTAAVVIPLVVGFWFRDLTAVAWSLLPAAVGGLIGWLQPGLLRPLFVVVTLVTFPIGIVIGELILLLVFFALVVPTGIVLKWSGRDPLRLRVPPDETTCWVRRTPPKSVRQYYRQS